MGSEVKDPVAPERAEDGGTTEKALLPLWAEIGLVAATALAVLLALALPSRIPAVDLAEHARILALLIGHPTSDAMTEAGLESNPLAPYWTFYAVAALFSGVTSPYVATRIAFALVAALIPVAVALWLRARGSAPILAVLSGLVVFSDPVAWGFVGMVTALPVAALLLAAAERLVAKPRWRWALVTSALVVVLYYSHLFVCIVGLGAAWMLIVLRPPSRRFLVPVIAATVVVAALAAAFLATEQETPYMEAKRAQTSGLLAFDWERPLDVIGLGASYGRPADRRLFVYALWAVAVVPALARRRREKSRREWRQRAFDLRYVIIFLVLLGASLVTSNTLLLWRRCGSLAAFFLPPALPPPRGRLALAAPLVATILVGFLASNAYTAGQEFTERTACVESLVARVRHPGRVLSLVGVHAPRGFAVPVYDHLGALLLAERGGRPTFEFGHTGVHAVRAARPAELPERQVMLLHVFPDLYDPALAASLDTIITVPPVDPTALLGRQRSNFEWETCGLFGLATRRSRPQ